MKILKKVQTETVGKEDEAETEGAEVEKVTQHISDVHQEDKKEHTKMKDVIQGEEVLKSEGHWVKRHGSIRNTPVFKCSGYCMFTDCPVEVDVTVHSEKLLKAQVSFSGGMVVHNKTELRRRPVRADAQKEISEQLQTTLPRAFSLQKMENLKESVVESGCREEAPSPSVLKTISWRERMKDRKHKKETLSLQMMVEEKTDEPDECTQELQAGHIFGRLTTASSIAEFDEMLLSCTVIFSSPCRSENVEKHFNNIQNWLTTIGQSVVDESSIVPEDLEDTFSPTPFQRHFIEVIGTAPLDKKGDPNVYYNGFQSCLLYQSLRQGGVVGTPQTPFVQILNINDNRWITASNLFCGPNEICIYDSTKDFLVDSSTSTSF
ncbi:hypothetical protein QQF64_036237 [Cirrhinus molitorella]|uniref:Uncharacterized protein n=1 Tax=Cirrhinus molitorella TaxID=172907 RepID=A0ABR3NI21_9TELE